MNALQRLRKLNEGLAIRPISDASFAEYGEVVESFDFSPIRRYVEQRYHIEGDGVRYVPAIEALADGDLTRRISDRFFGQMPIQVGCCYGTNSRLNGLEYHKGSELTVACTDLLIIVGRTVDIRDGQYDTANTDIYFVPEGTAFELYATTLHYAPCMSDREGFRTVVILPKGTNLPLRADAAEEEAFLFMRNKWLLCHPENVQDISQGAKIGLVGENITIRC